MIDLLTKASATISPDGLYRYLLARCWGAELGRVRGSHLTFIMLNPSTADAETDDRTIGRCRGFAQSWGYDGMLVYNLFAYRATDPRELDRVADPVGPMNPGYLADLLKHEPRDTPIVCAWGSFRQAKRPEAIAAILTLQQSGCRLVSIGPVSKDGSPRHPLYLDGSLTAQPFTPALYHG